ncbi:hypothetical protein VTN02DRAFT_2078 [Thermoascus thermophilus]
MCRTSLRRVGSSHTIYLRRYTAHAFYASDQAVRLGVPPPTADVKGPIITTWRATLQELGLALQPHNFSVISSENSQLPMRKNIWTSLPETEERSSSGQFRELCRSGTG